MAAHAQRVFISYSHDSERHKGRVLSLAQDLIAHGIDCVVDQLLEGVPTEGWVRWMVRQVTGSDHVLLVCSENYSRAFLGLADHSGSLGADWEGHLILQELYERHSRNDKFIPVIFDNSDVPHIPLPLRTYNRYLLPRDYRQLLAALTGERSRAEAPPPVLTSGLGISRTALSNAIDFLDARLASPRLSVSQRATLLVERADHLQRAGLNRKAWATLRDYEQLHLSPHSNVHDRYLLSRGKLISQSHRRPKELLHYLDSLAGRQWSEGASAVAPLLWRLGILWAPSSHREATKTLSLHDDLLERESYQRAHTWQCTSLIELSRVSSQRVGQCDSDQKIESSLDRARFLYLSQDSFVHRDKCLASNLAIVGALWLMQDRPIRAFMALLHARVAFRQLGVSPHEEAISEVAGLLQAVLPDAHSIVFGSALAIGAHRRSALIREAFGDVQQYWQAHDWDPSAVLASPDLLQHP